MAGDFPPDHEAEASAYRRWRLDSNNETTPAFVILAMNGALSRRATAVMRGRALAKIAAISEPCRSPAVSEHADGRHADRGQRGRTITNAAVLGQNDPAALTDLTQPLFVESRGRKVIVVDLDLCPGESQGASDNLVAEGTIDEEDERFRRLVRRARTG